LGVTPKDWREESEGKKEVLGATVYQRLVVTSTEKVNEGEKNQKGRVIFAGKESLSMSLTLGVWLCQSGGYTLGASREATIVMSGDSRCRERKRGRRGHA